MLSVVFRVIFLLMHKKRFVRRKEGLKKMSFPVIVLYS